MKFVGFTVQLTTKDANHTDVALEEMGVKLSKSNLNRKIASCFVESTKDVSFGVQIQAETPFPYPQEQVEATGQKLPGNAGSAASSDGSGKFPYNFLVEVFLDGKNTSEIKRYLYVDPSYELIMEGHDCGRQYLNHSLKRDRAGRIRKYHWVFDEAGGIGGLVDSINNLTIGEAVPNADVDKGLTETLASTELVNKDEASSAGQIKVIIHRVIIDRGIHRVDRNWGGFGDMEHAQDKWGEDVKRGTTYLKDNTYKHPTYLSLITYQQYIKDENPYATFIFYYRTADVLKKFGFKGKGTTGGGSVRLSGGLMIITKHKREQSDEVGDMSKRIKEDWVSGM